MVMLYHVYMKLLINCCMGLTCYGSSMEFERRKKRICARLLFVIRPNYGRIQGRICRAREKKLGFWPLAAIRPVSGRIGRGFRIPLELAIASYPAKNPAIFRLDSGVAGTVHRRQIFVFRFIVRCECSSAIRSFVVLLLEEERLDMGLTPILFNFLP